MSNGRFSFCPNNLGVQVIETGCSSVAETQCDGLLEGLAGEEIVQGAKLAVFRDKPELRLDPNVLVIGRDEAQNVGMADETGLVYLDLVEPRKLLLRVEDLHGHLVTLVHALPHLPEAPFPDQTVQGDLSRNGALNQQRETRSASRVFQ